MTLKRKLIASAVLLAIASTAQAKDKPPVIPDHQAENPWFTAGEAAVKSRDFMKGKGEAMNIILFVGDGMGVTTVTAARILEGQLNGEDGEENNLSFDLFPYTGLAKTYNVNAQVPDSAGTMTAMMSGVKTDIGVLGLDEDADYEDCSSAAGNELVTALELAELAGLSTGIVSTARITHATPAGTFAKSPSRDWEDISDMTPAAIADGCIDIAVQLVEFEQRLEDRYPQSNVDGIEVAMGGGRRHFLRKIAADNSGDQFSAVEGDRTDGRNLTAEWQVAYPTGDYIIDQTGFDAIDPENTTRLFGLFDESHMNYEADRPNDTLGEPSLEEMTTKAIQILDNNKKGYFLHVEAGRIDHGHHAGSGYNALTDTIELAQAVQAAVDTADMSKTLILVTADHGHVFTIAGYPKRGNPILGKVIEPGSVVPALASDGLPYTTLGYANGLGFRDLGDETNADVAYDSPPDTGRKDLTGVDTEASGYHQEALVPLADSETHSGEEVTVYGIGPGSHAVIGTNEQSVVFHVMNQGAKLAHKAKDANK